MKFMKMQGLGNDYVYIDCFQHRVDNPGELAVRVSNRHFGVGSDGLILICPSDKGQVRMDMYNADGSRSQMCGNGARCVAKYAYDHGYVASKNFLLETLGGMREVTILREVFQTTHYPTMVSGKTDSNAKPNRNTAKFSTECLQIL